MCSSAASRTGVVVERAEAARRRFIEGAVEWTGANEGDVLDTTPLILAVSTMPSNQSELHALLSRWRRTVNVDAELHLIERQRPDHANGVTSAIRSRLPVGGVPFERDIVAALRDAGWTIVAIERFDLVVDGETQRWVELRATDVIGQVQQAPS